MNNACREYMFGIEFFGFAGEAAYQHFKTVMVWVILY